MLRSYNADVNRFADAEIVTLLVGPNKVTFSVHKDILCQASPYFKKAFNSGFKEAAKQSLTLAKDNPDNVDSIVKWVYFRILEDSVPKDRETAPVYARPLQLYFLADKYDIPELRKELVQYFYGNRFHDEVPN